MTGCVLCMWAEWLNDCSLFSVCECGCVVRYRFLWLSIYRVLIILGTPCICRRKNFLEDMLTFTEKNHHVFFFNVHVISHTVSRNTLECVLTFYRALAKLSFGLVKWVNILLWWCLLGIAWCVFYFRFFFVMHCIISNSGVLEARTKQLQCIPRRFE